MKVLLTGHNGYIGSVMSTKLQEAGHEVVGLDTNYFKYDTFGFSPVIPEIVKDIRDVSVSDLAGFDAIIHLAALSNDPMAEIDQDLTYDINLFATLRLAQVAKFAGVKRFLFASSCSVYGAGAMTEDGTLYPISAYAISKVRSEEGLERLSDSDFSPTFLRNGTAYGYSPRFRTDLVLNKMVADACIYGKITVMGDGSLWRPLVHVEDISRAFIMCLENPREIVHNQVFNVGGNEENYHVREMAEIVKYAVLNTEIEHVDNGKDARSYIVDFSKIKDVLGFIPQWRAVDGAMELKKKYKESGVTKGFLENFVRLTQLKKLMKEKRVDEQLRWRRNG